MVEGLLQAIAQQPWTVAGRSLDLCGGAGHLTRVLTGLQSGAGLVRLKPNSTWSPPSGGPQIGAPVPGTVLADLFFWKLWLAGRFTSPACAPVCCDANHPLPFAPNA